MLVARCRCGACDDETDDLLVMIACYLMCVSRVDDQSGFFVMVTKDDVPPPALPRPQPPGQ